jgi:hypothetical protein
MMPRSTPRQVVLHVGLPKTGTTYLQEGFVRHRDALLACGVSYPKFGQEHLAGHHNLTLHLRGMPVVSADYGDLSAEGAVRRAIDENSNANVLLSSEGFSALAAGGVATLLRAIAECEPRVVVYLRRRSQLMASSWQEAVKHGSPLGLLEYVASRVLGSGARTLRFEQVLTSIAQAFGREAMRVIVYDHLLEDGVDIMDHFTSTILDLDGFEASRDRSTKSNQAVGAAQLEVVRAVNQLLLARGGITSIQLTSSLQRLLMHDAAARDLVRRVEEVRDSRGEELDLGVLDGEWLDRDRLVLEHLGNAVCNPASESELFRPARSTKVRMLRPAELQAAIPLSEFVTIAERAGRDSAM